MAVWFDFYGIYRWFYDYFEDFFCLILCRCIFEFIKKQAKNPKHGFTHGYYWRFTQFFVNWVNFFWEYSIVLSQVEIGSTFSKRRVIFSWSFNLSINYTLFNAGLVISRIELVFKILFLEVSKIFATIKAIYCLVTVGNIYR